MEDHPYNNTSVQKHLKMIANANKWDQVVARGCITGLFSGIGTIAGFILIGFVLVNIFSNLKQIPFLDSILAQTKLDVLIESQVNRLTQETSSSSSDTQTSTTSSAAPVDTELTYSDAAYGIQFSYPSSFNSVKEVAGANGVGKIIQINSTAGALHNLDIHIDQDLKISGASIQRFIPMDEIDRIVLNAYETGATINGTHYDNAVFYVEVTENEHQFQFVGLANQDTPKLAREIYAEILGSLSFTETGN